MPRLAVILITLFSVSGIYAQSADSLFNIQVLDSLKDALPSNPLDSIGMKQKQKLDSIQNAASNSFNSIKLSYDSVNTAAHNAASKIQHSVDSLTTLQLPIDKFTTKLDSIADWQNTKLGKLKLKADSVRSKTLEKINSMELPPALQEQAQKLTSNVQKLDISLPNSQLPDLALKNSLSLPTADLPGIENPLGQSIPSVDGNLNLPSVGGEVGEVTDKIEQASGMIPKNVDDIPKAIEQQAGKVSEVQAISEQMGQADQYKDVLTQGQDPEAMKQQALDKAKEVAIDHFAGKEQQLQEAMQQIAKYKQKYSSVQSLADLPKKRPNEMKNKPLIERVIPGIAFQIYRKDEWLVDLNAYAGYRFTGRLTAGAGWNHRIGYNVDKRYFSSELSIYGPRMYGEFKAFKGVSGRAEVEWMNTYVPPKFSSKPNDPEGKEWVFGLMVGIKKEYRFFKNVKGTVLILYNVHDPHHRSPYADRMNMRFGFEFPMKKKVKPQE